MEEHRGVGASWRAVSCFLRARSQSNRKSAQLHNQPILKLFRPCSRVVSLRERQLEPLHDQRNHHPHFHHCQVPPCAICRAVRERYKCSRVRHNPVRLRLRSHIRRFLGVFCELFRRALCRACMQPAVRPEELWIRREVLWVTEQSVEGDKNSSAFRNVAVK